MTELVEVRGYSVALSYRLFGHTRQAWYQSKADIPQKSSASSFFWIMHVKSVKRILVSAVTSYGSCYALSMAGIR